ncbi:U3 small nucleolar ribonucleoprotein protein IMP4-like [Varroa jacobsoni]|uniref:Brix domain-containing protein n=1 Tax=Varroa destructor TaxID=109461 RepID=A0A7M7K9I4_VARDE|nr:U3 small nucleolar ribonucleoprotein protein IMP4-like [Varroa destructor]XP_022693097.1 U3 small nucleolar ribonucleoprotein protein IMP4-like [Varroa jacobsoni]
MLRRYARERREYLYNKTVDDKRKRIEAKKEKLRTAVEGNRPLPTELRNEALKLHESLEWDLATPFSHNAEDDEYRWAGVTDPKIVITTTHDPSASLKQFAKELKLIFPNAQKMNRGTYDLKELVTACRANEVTDFIIVQETRGRPDGLVICHLPYGPTAYFTIYNAIMRHEIPDIGTISEAYPHLLFNNFTTKLGKRVESILKYLFPVPKQDSKRVITFANVDDYILFRHHTYSSINGQVELQEVGPRFELKLYDIKLGSIDEAAALDSEWSFKPFMNTTRKRLFLGEPSELADGR